MKTTTLNKIKAHGPCSEGFSQLLAYLGKTQPDDEQLLFSTIIESNGFDDALWCCRSAPEYEREWRLFAVWCARRVQHLMTDKRSIQALDVAERYANGNAVKEELIEALAAAGEAAWAAARAAGAVWAAAREAARAAGEAARAAQKEQFLRICGE